MTRRHRILMLLAVALLIVLAAPAVLLTTLDRDRAVDVAAPLAQDLARVCAVDPAAAAAAAADCGRAVAVARDGVAGPQGAQGEPGRGIVATRLDGGRLILVYTDGATVDVGQVVGADGQPGEPGRGITDTAVVGGRLIITFSDGTTSDLGPVVGPAGRGIASLDGSTGRLLVTLTDGEVVDLGPLPPGPPGPPGAEGQRGADGAPAPSVRSVTRTYDDGSVERCLRTGGPDTDPELACTVDPATGPPAPDPTDPVLPDVPPTDGG